MVKIAGFAMSASRKSKIFPDARQATPEGIVAIGGEINVENLLEAYSCGIFPWPQPGAPMLWFSPDPRGVLDFEDFHVPSSLKKFKKKSDWQLTINKAFREVMLGCQKQIRPDQLGTWILPEMVTAYEKLHHLGNAISCECWDKDELVGGIYGVLNQGLFSGESMFYRRSQASKLAFWHLIEFLKTQNHTWIDIQMVTPVTEAFGGKYIAKEEFLRRRGL